MGGPSWFQLTNCCAPMTQNKPDPEFCGMFWFRPRINILEILYQYQIVVYVGEFHEGGFFSCIPDFLVSLQFGSVRIIIHCWGDLGEPVHSIPLLWMTKAHALSPVRWHSTDHQSPPPLLLIVKDLVVLMTLGLAGGWSALTLKSADVHRWLSSMLADTGWNISGIVCEYVMPCRSYMYLKLVVVNWKISRSSLDIILLLLR